jgi:hypothetical protein
MFRALWLLCVIMVSALGSSVTALIDGQIPSRHIGTKSDGGVARERIFSAGGVGEARGRSRYSSA